MHDVWCMMNVRRVDGGRIFSQRRDRALRLFHCHVRFIASVPSLSFSDWFFTLPITSLHLKLMLVFQKCDTDSTPTLLPILSRHLDGWKKMIQAGRTHSAIGVSIFSLNIQPASISRVFHKIDFKRSNFVHYHWIFWEKLYYFLSVIF